MGGVGSGRRSTAKAVCSRPGHSGSRVRFDGTYGPHGHRRQRYRCFPANGDTPHVFTEVLPREESWHGDCDICERPVELHNGPQAARQYQFVARGIAGALKSAGAGSSYMGASRVARDRADRTRGRPVVSRHGQLVGDWVEVFAPVIFEPHRPTEWPATGTLVVDHLPFRNRARDRTGRLIPAGRVAFDVFCAMGYVDGEPKLWRMEAFTNASRANWEVFFRRLDGAPPRVVCDAHSGMLAAIRSVWPATDLYLCEWHLAHALERLLDAQAKKGHAAATATLSPRVRTAFIGAAFWGPFERDCRAAGIGPLDRWLDKNDPIIRAQFARRGLAAMRPPDLPLTTGGLETKTRPIRDTLHPRRYALKNRERLNRLLMLMQLHANGDDSEVAYRKLIRDWLLSNNGRPFGARRAITGPLGAPSLR